MQGIDSPRLEKVLSRPWTTDNQTFTARCWTDKAKLVETVNQELTRMIATGAAPNKAISAIAKQFNTSKSNAGRVVMTESAYFSSAAQQDCFNELGVEEYRIVGTLDKSMCDLCGGMDGKVFKMSEFKVGATAPPFHPWCRCCTAPYFADMEGVGRRFARDPDDEFTYTVPKDMTYKQWKEIQDEQTKYAKGIKFNKIHGEGEISKTLKKDLNAELDKFKGVFGDFDTLTSVEAHRYLNDGVYGGYNPNSEVIQLMGAGGDKGISFMRESAKINYKAGQWSTSHYLHSFRHELGHAYQQYLSKVDLDYAKKITAIEKIRGDIISDLTAKYNSGIIKSVDEGKKNILSLYGLDEGNDIDELISECIAEYVNGKPRSTARNVVEILLG